MNAGATKFLTARSIHTRRVALKGFVRAFAAVGATVWLPDPRLAAQSGASGRTFPVTTVNHLGYACGPDYTRTRNWYVELFGMRIAWDDGTQCGLEFGDPAKPNGMYLRSAAAGARPEVHHFAFGIPNIVPQLPAMKAELERWQLKNVRPDGAHGWTADDPAGYRLNVWVPEKDEAMFPGAGGPCADAASAACKAAYQRGLANLGTLPKATSRSFTTTAFGNMHLHVPREMLGLEHRFYRDVLGMRTLHQDPDRVFLGFGKNVLALEVAPDAVRKPYCSRYGFTLEQYDHARVGKELSSRGLKPVATTARSWAVQDPDGMTIDVAGPGFMEYVASNCRGALGACASGQ